MRQLTKPVSNASLIGFADAVRHLDRRLNAWAADTARLATRRW